MPATAQILSITKHYAKIPHFFLENIQRFGLDAKAKIIFYVQRETFGWNRPTCPRNIQKIMEATGLPRESVYRAIADLEKRDVLDVTKESIGFSRICINIDTNEEIREIKDTGDKSEKPEKPCINIDTRHLYKKENNKENNDRGPDSESEIKPVQDPGSKTVEVSSSFSLLIEAVKGTATKQIKNLIARHLRKHGFDYVYEAIMYANAHSNQPGKYKKYLGLTLDRGWADGYMDDLKKSKEQAEAKEQARIEAVKREAEKEAAIKAQMVKDAERKAKSDEAFNALMSLGRKRYEDAFSKHLEERKADSNVDESFLLNRLRKHGFQDTSVDLAFKDFVFRQFAVGNGGNG